MSLLSALRGGGGQVEARAVSEWDIPWSNRGQSSTSVDEFSSYNLSAVWACQTLIADSIATLPIDVFRKQDSTRIPVVAPLWIEKPNPEWNRIEFETQRLLSLLGWGNAYTLLVRKNGSVDPQAPVVERWVLNPAHMVVRRRTNQTDVRDEIVYWYLGREIPTANIQHIRGYTLPGWVMGMSPIMNANRTLLSAVESQNAGLKFYQQGMMMAGVLSIPQLPAEAGKDVIDSLRDQFSTMYGGSNNAGRPAVLSGGTTWKETSVSPADAALLETRRFELNEICRWYRVPPWKISDVDHASQGGGHGLETQNASFAQDTQLPWTVRLEEADSALLPRGQYVRYNIDAGIRSDLATRFTNFEKGRNAGFLSANDIRRMEDMAPIPNGDIYLQPLNYIEAGTEPVPPVTASTSVTPQDTGVPS